MTLGDNLSNNLINNLGEIPTREIDRVAVRIPPFSPAEPELWFTIVERSFAASGIKEEETKFGHVLGALDSRYTVEVKDIIMKPPATAPFTKLKEELIKRLSSSQEKKTLQLLEDAVMGDRKPSQFLRCLRDLAGAAVNDGFLRTVFVSRLPEAIKPVLATQKDASLDKLAEVADAIMDSLSATPRQLHEAQATTSLEATLNVKMAQLALNMRQEIAAIVRQEIEGARIFQQQHQQSRYSRPFSRSRSRPRSLPRTRSPSRDRHPPDSDTCWYHLTFGARAKKCQQPCKYSGNAMDGH